MKDHLFNKALVHTFVLVALCLPYCINLGKSSIWDANEAFYAETPREMLASGNYLAPHFNFQPRAQKPPLIYWAVLISYKIFGVNEFGVRLPSALAAIGTIFFAYGLSRLLFGAHAALLAAAVTATTARIFILARRLPIDILLLFFMTGILFFIVRATQKKDRRSWAFAYLFAALGFLTKGPVALVVPACSYILWALWSRRLKISEVHPLMGAAIFACIVLPWYVYIYGAYGWTYISPFFLRDNLGRFATQSLGPSRNLIYYIPVFASDFFPWSFLALFSIYVLWCERKEAPLKSLSFGLPLFWCALIFVLFSLSRNKQEYYIAPIYPAAAVILSGVLEKRMTAAKVRNFKDAPLDKPDHSWRGIHGFIAVFFLLMALLLPYVFSSFMPNISPVLHYGPSLILIGGFTWQVWSLAGRRFAQCFAATAITMWTTCMICALLYLPALEQFRPVKSFCKTIEAQSDREDEAGVFGTALPSMVYYLRRPIFEENSPDQMLQRFRSEKRIFCVLSQKDLGYFMEQKDLKIHILDRHSRFALRFGTVLNAGYAPGEELLLVSNRPYSILKPGRSGPR